MTQDPENVVLVCNPRAGGRWKQLAGILDSAEAQHVRRIVTDSIDDIGPALANLRQRTKLLVIYGGDGTIQQIISDTFRAGNGPEASAAIALIGGGTMNLTSRWCGFSGSPEKNFRQVVQNFFTDRLMTREVPLLEIRQGPRTEYGFIFGAGVPIRILNEYEHGSKGKLAAVGFFARSAAALLYKNANSLRSDLSPMQAEVVLDGEPLLYDRLAGVFCGITSNVSIGVQPFVGERQRDTFHCLAYAAAPREVAVLLPFLVRGLLPIDARSLAEPVSTLRHMGLSYFGRGSLPIDPRYVNRCVSTFEMRSAEEVYTVDGEIFESTGEPLTVGLGPTVRLAVKTAAPQPLV